MHFDDLGLAPDLLKAVADQGYTEPTPIQAQAIPVILAGQDLIFDIEATYVRLDDGSEEDRFEDEDVEVSQPEVELRNEKGPRETPATLPVFH